MRVIAVSVVASLTGCMYIRGNLDHDKSGYKNYPASVEAEHERRSTRRRNALIASPIEIIGGAGIAALALFAKSSPMNDGNDSVVDNLGDAGKEIAGRLLMASIGGVAVLGGVGDLVFGVTDPLYASPLVRNGELVTADRVDALEPPHSPRLTLHLGTVLGTQGVGSELGFGLAHWLNDNVRLRHAVTGNYLLAFGGAHESQGIVTVDTNIERAFGRQQAGLYPRKSIGAYGGGGWMWTSASKQGPVAIGGMSFDLGRVVYRLGARYTPTIERYPSIDLTAQMEIGGD